MNEASEYQGMRWFKCDLHVHTPEDAHHWQDSDLRLLSPRHEIDLQERAQRFLRHCHELQLDCMAVVDHNFSIETDSRMWFLSHLIEQNSTVAESVGRAPLVIFPGFELDIRYHLLCLFNPVKKGSKLQKISDILTNMGLAPNARISSDVFQQPKHHGQCWSLREILDKVQNELEGIVIAAHAFSDDGICNDTANIPDFRDNPDLYAVEVNTWPLSGKVQSILDGSDSSWKRPVPHRQPAAICGSDGKSLQDSSCANSIGRRISWIKMSDPSCESLRQAFLDPGSRICLASEPAPTLHTHLRCIQIKGTKFLQDQTVLLSPHLNCLIGGRGSGKSMLFESLRLGLRGEMPFKDVDPNNHVAARQVRRLKGTFQLDTRIQLEVSHDGLEDRFIVENLGTPARIEGRHAEDPPTVFRGLNALIFSQEEITQLAERQKSLLEFVDSLAPDRLGPHRAKARGIIDRLRSARQTNETVNRLDSELTVLRQELEELSRQLSAKAQVQEELKSHRAAQEAKRYLDSLQAKARETEERLQSLSEELETEPSPLGSRVESFPETEFFKQIEEKVGEIYRSLAGQLRTAADNFRKSFQAATSGSADMQKAIDAISQAEKAFHEACDAKGLTPEEAEKLRETELQHRAKQAAHLAKQAERDTVANQQPDMCKLLEELATAWREESRARLELLKEITESESMPRTQGGSPILKTSLTFAGDRASFLRLWGELAPDRRRNVGQVWDRYASDRGTDNVGDQLFDTFRLYIDSDPTAILGNAIQWLEVNWSNEDVLPKLVKLYKSEIDRARKEKADKWFELMLTRIPDAADLTLLRSDGSEAGSFEKGDLSTGQQNTAILSLLLALGHGPVLIDQPEDELDSEFLFRELVPMLRKAKSRRQLIIVTHNANIPVNADAELVYALKAESGRGVCRAQGGLDRAGVTKAVLDIMEGSEEAFRRRKEKYHF